MKRNGFVAAVTAAVRQQTDCWEGIYYHANKWSPAARKVYMETRASALGPEWRALQSCVVSMKTGGNVEHITKITR